MFHKSTLLLILVAALVNWLTRVTPYVFVRFAKLPAKVEAFLSYLPVCIMFAFILSSVFPAQEGHFPQVKWIELFSLLPTALVLHRSKNIIWTILVGVACVAVLRALVG